MFCFNCGNQLSGESNFCSDCGTNIKNINNINIDNNGKCLFSIKRIASYNGSALNFNIYIDGQLVKELSNGEAFSMTLKNGRHIIYCEAFGMNRTPSLEFTGNSNCFEFHTSFPSVFETLLSSSDTVKTLALEKFIETEPGTYSENKTSNISIFNDTEAYNEINNYEKIYSIENENKKVKKKKIPIFLIIAISGFILLMINIFSDNSRSTPTPSAMNVTLHELINSYNTNSVSADSKYQNKNIIVTGKVLYIGTARWSGNPVITFSGGDLFNTNQLRMTFNSSYTKSIANLNIGDTITVEGKFTGRQDALFLTIFQMTNCRIRE